MEKTKVLVLEDDHNRHKQFKERFIENGNISYTIVETADACLTLLKNERYDMVFLDHDIFFINQMDFKTALGNSSLESIEVEGKCVLVSYIEQETK